MDDFLEKVSAHLSLKKNLFMYHHRPEVVFQLRQLFCEQNLLSERCRAFGCASFADLLNTIGRPLSTIIILEFTSLTLENTNLGTVFTSLETVFTSLGTVFLMLRLVFSGMGLVPSKLSPVFLCFWVFCQSAIFFCCQQKTLF